jgi:hypothetical protein
MTILLLSVLAALSSPPIVDVPGLGTILGAITTPGNSTYSLPAVAGFTGIPYAEPPTGDLRWKPPIEHGPWKNQIDGTKFGSFCLGSLLLLTT